jgi:capsular polysaccharide biosynthesis protein
MKNDELGTIEYNNVLFDPRYCALFTSTGKLIESTILTRGEGEKVTSPPLQIKTDRCPVFIKEAVFIHSFGYHHYGHFLTEQIAKLWYLEKSDLPVIFHNNIPKKTTQLFQSFQQLPPYQKFFLSKLNNFEPNRMVFASKQIKLERVILPEASFVIRHSAHSVHRELCQKIARQICTTHKNDKVIYLSRSKLHHAKRQVQGENELEVMLRNQGVEVIYPETLNLAEQIKLINNVKTIIGSVGSALHTLLFALFPHSKVITLSNTTLNTNFQLIDELMQLNNYYINCLTDFEKASDNIEMDVELAFSGIMQVLAK